MLRLRHLENTLCKTQLGRQYKKESFEIQLFPSSEDLPVSASELIAISGSTGGFVGPHLHFEIRDTKSEKPINPFFFGFEVSDTKKPKILNVLAYALDERSHVNALNLPSQLTFKKLDNGDLVTDKINAIGTIGFGVNSYDQLNGAANKNGLYSLEMYVNNAKVHEFKAETFSFSESKYINLLIDYQRFKQLKQRVQKCFVEPANRLSLYDRSPNNGYITIEDGFSYTVKIIAKDYSGNETSVTIPVLGKASPILVSESPKLTSHKIDHTIFNKIVKGGVTVAIPKNTFYKDLYLDLTVEGEKVKAVYENGILNGQANYYNIDGKLIYNGVYENDERVGDWKYYNDGKN